MPAAILDAELRLQSADAAFCRALGWDAPSAGGRSVEELGQGRWDGTVLRPALAALAADPASADAPPLDLRLEPMLLGVGVAPLWLRAQRLETANGPEIKLWLPVAAAPGPAPGPTVVKSRPSELAGPRSDGPGESAAADALGMLGRESYLLQLLMEAVPDVIFIKDRESRFVQANHALARKLGLSDPRLVIGKTDRDFFAPDLAEAFRQRDELVLVHGQSVVNWEQREEWRDGSETWALVTELPLRDAQGEIAGLLGLTRDVTERRRAQDALEASERMYRSLFERGLCGVFLTTPAGRIVDCNDAFVRVLGYGAREEVLARPATEMYFHADERAQYVERLRREGALANIEARLRRQDGSEVWVLENTALVRDDKGEELLQGTLIDITERRQLEARLSEGQKMQAIGRLAGGVAHDFNNLLTVITGQCEMLELQAEPGAPSNPRVAAIRAAAQRAAALTRQLLAFGRQLPVVLAAVDLNACVRGAAELLRSMMGDAVVVEIELASGLDTVQADRREIEQALLHLAGNARAAMPRGGRLTVRTFDAVLDAESAGRGHLAPGRYAVLAVGDSGVGIAPEMQARIFEPFFTTQEVGHGSGLGLAGIQGMAQLSGGDVQLRSTPGQGSTFEIWLPTLPSPVAAAPPTVLCVQPDANLRAVLREVLAGAGYVVLEAGGAAETLVHCQRHPRTIHLLFGELGGAAEGWELAQQVRAVRPEIQLLAITAFADRLAAAQTASRMGAYLLLKPFTPEAVLDRVREILGAPQSATAKV